MGMQDLIRSTWRDELGKKGRGLDTKDPSLLRLWSKVDPAATRNVVQKVQRVYPVIQADEVLKICKV